MAHFTTSAKRFSEGTSYPSFGGANLNVPAGGDDFTYTAPEELPDSPTNRKFLFWDTGRRVTTKRTVHWTFHHPDQWTTWDAVAWYGVPGAGPGTPGITATSYWVGTGLMDPTPIDGAASTFPAGAWPAGGNDHAIDTTVGAGTLRALEHLQRHPSDPMLNFSGLARLVFGGDDSSVFEENDEGLPAGGSTVIGIEGSDLQLNYPQNDSAVVLASYVQPAPVRFRPPRDFSDLLVAQWIDKLKLVGDPSPEDIIRVNLITEAISKVRAAGGAPRDFDAFRSLIEAAGEMSATELKRAIAGTQATLRRGEAALKSMQAIAAKTARQK